VPPKNLPHWIAADADAGTRLDKFLAAPERVGSRARVSDALRRGRIFLNDVEATHADASTRVMARDVLTLWMDRPGSARKLFAPRTTGELRILY